MTDTSQAGPTLEEAGALAPLVTAAEAARRVDAGALLVDVRSAAGRAGAGEIPGATVVDKSAVASAFDLASDTHLPAVTSLDLPIVVICGSVLGSGPSAAALLAMGFRDVVHVEGGFPAWQAAGLPVLEPAATPQD
ncbi:rhodanese-like domain-containing protein [Pseudonocardia xinjiangensis]|uniref:rhodanese-like domain-containing protein n=1 Tax=Pseudonocardia xinjiangensis TaxID=75289 RepID=UPI003D8E5012